MGGMDTEGRKTDGAAVAFPRTAREAWRQLTGDGASAHPLVQFFKYAFVGGMSTGVHVVAFSAAAWWVFPCVTENDLVVKIFGLTAPEVEESVRASLTVKSNVCAWVCSNAFCYVLNRLFVFRPGRLSVVAEFLAFSAVGGFSMFVGSAAMAWLVSAFGVQTSIAFLTNLVASLAFNYALRKFFIFKG